VPTVPRDRLLGELIVVREYASLRRHSVYAGRDMPDVEEQARRLERRLERIAPVAIAAVGTLGLPRVFRASCFLGECCRRFRTELHGPFPDGVSFVAVFSKRDGIVDLRRVTERAATPVEVRASHLGLVVNPDAYRAVADALQGFGR
jgi:hypothetical protein